MTIKRFNPNVRLEADTRRALQIILMNFEDIYANAMFAAGYDADVDGLIDLAHGGLELDASGVLKGSIIVCNANGVFSLIQSSTENYVPSVQADGTIAWGLAVPTLDEVGDVTITAIASGELLKWSGTAWINNTLAEAGIASTDHDATHERAGSDEIDGDHLDIDWTPTNYTPATTPGEAADVDDLTAHLYGIDQALAGAVSHTLDSATHSDVTAITEAQGQILYYDGSNWNALGPGTNGYFLKTQGAAANPVWAEVSGGDADTLDGHEGAEYRSKVSISAGAESDDAIDVTIHIEDLDGTDETSGQWVLHVWLSDAAGGGITGTAPNGGVSVWNGVVIQEIVADKHWVLMTDTEATLNFSISETGAQTWYCRAEIDGKVYTSAAITFAA